MLDHVFETDFDNNAYFKNMDKDFSSQKDFKQLMNKDAKEFNVDILPDVKPKAHAEKKPTKSHKKTAKAKKSKKAKKHSKKASSLAEKEGVGVSKELGDVPVPKNEDKKPKTKREKE